MSHLSVIFLSEIFTSNQQTKKHIYIFHKEKQIISNVQDVVLDLITIL